MMRDLVQLFAIFCVLFLPVMLIFGRPFIRQWFELKHKRLDADTRLAAEKAAQYATSNAELEQRVRVLEQIVTDGGIHTANQIEALRAPRLIGEK
jgi:hypothetical protein